MSTAIEAVYEGGILRPLLPLSLPEHTRVQVSLEILPSDPERAAWLAQSEFSLRAVWENDADDVYNELLSR